MKKKKKKVNVASAILTESLAEYLSETCSVTNQKKSDIIRSSLELRRIKETNGPEILLICSKMVDALEKNKENFSDTDFETICNYPITIMKLMNDEEDENDTVRTKKRQK